MFAPQDYFYYRPFTVVLQMKSSWPSTVDNIQTDIPQALKDSMSLLNININHQATVMYFHWPEQKVNKRKKLLGALIEYAC